MLYSQPDLAKIKQAIKDSHRFGLIALESMPVFQVPTSLEELAKRPKPPTAEILQEVDRMKDIESQVLAGCWVDTNQTILAVYFGQRFVPESSQGDGNSGAKAKVRQALHSSCPWAYILL